MRRSHFVPFAILLSACSALEGVDTVDERSVAPSTPPRGEQALDSAWDIPQAGTFGSAPYGHDSDKPAKGKGEHKKPKRPAPKPGEKDDGSSIYGDGSAGARNFDQPVAELNEANSYQFTNFTVQSGTTLLVNSGTVLRCTGTFRNDGTIVVRVAAGTGFIGLGGLLPNLVLASTTPADPGISLRTAGNATINFPLGGDGGSGVGDRARLILQPGVKAGGGGGGLNVLTPSGGGSFTVLCKKGIFNSGTIAANGLDGPGSAIGGGGGGIIILASKTEVTSDGNLHAMGGDGGDATIIPNEEAHGGGGGGGGGIVHVLSPSIDVDEDGVLVNGGLGGAGTANLVPAGLALIGGGGGGACAGSGGNGAGVSVGNPIPAAQAGQPGRFLRTVADPSDLF